MAISSHVLHFKGSRASRVVHALENNLPGTPLCLPFLPVDPFLGCLETTIHFIEILVHHQSIELDFSA
jgi:hypothetical protein